MQSQAGLSGFHSCNLEGYNVAAIKEGIFMESSGWKVPSLIVNLEQRPNFHKMFQLNGVPALLKKSVLYDLVKDQVLDAEYHWLIQGFSCPRFGINSEGFPFPSLLEDGADCFTPEEMKRLTGNSMHWAPIGAWFIFSIAFSGLKTEAEAGCVLADSAAASISARPA